jgi:hypothetical protein
MNELWRRTVELWRRYPVLAVPILVADPVSYGLRRLGPGMRYTVVTWVYTKLTEEHSVLGGTTQSGAHTGIATAASYFAAPLITLLFSWAEVAAYVVAAIVITRMIRRLLAKDDVELSRETPLGSYAAGILWLSLLTLLVAYCADIPLGALWLYWRQFHMTSSFVRMPVLNCLLVWPGYLLIALVLTPMCLRLMARSARSVMRGDVGAMGRRASIYAGVAIVVLSGLSSIKICSIASSGQKIVFGAILSLVVALPYIPLFISLSLLALDGSTVLVRGEEVGEVAVS